MLVLSTRTIHSYCQYVRSLNASAVITCVFPLIVVLVRSRISVWSLFFLHSVCESAVILMRECNAYLRLRENACDCDCCIDTSMCTSSPRRCDGTLARLMPWWKEAQTQPANTCGSLSLATVYCPTFPFCSRACGRLVSSDASASLFYPH